MKNTTKGVYGTSFHGTTVRATVGQLEEILGEPVYDLNDGKDKTNYEWNMETNAGQVFTVYDWKEYQPLEDGLEYEWHIGGRDASVTMQALSEIEEALKKTLSH
jgi:hypothetical protein